MPAISPQILVNAILDAIQASGYSGVLLSRIKEHPLKFSIISPDSVQDFLWVYAWTLTHGGRKNLPNEYRIQMTSVNSPLELNPNGPTMLIGYEPSIKVFAGFDLNRHSNFTTGSPSVQININSLHDALQNGLGFDRKTNDEIAIGFRPDQFLFYSRNAENLHLFGSESRILSLLEIATSNYRLEPNQLENLTGERERIVQMVSRMARLGSFRQQVLNAYGNRCAVSRIQLRLVEAAHILPVGAPGSDDNVQNGILLSPTYHRAYDNGLIYLDETYIMKINPEKEQVLTSQNLDGGLVGFKGSLGKIHLPQDNNQRPDPKYIRRGNQFRGIKLK